MSGVKVNGQWKNTADAYVRVDSDWRTVSESFVKVGGIWQRSTLGSPPEKPNIVYHSYGQFRITNYDSTLNYQTRFNTGSGSASLNTSTGIYTLSGENSGFYVSSAYAAGAPRSQEGYMERKKYTYTFRNVSYTENYSCNCRLDAACFCNPGNVQPCSNPSWGQCGCPTEMCWIYYNGVVCDTCTRTVCCRQIYDVLVNEPGYTNSGSEWYKVN